jgi:hypothetical protein
MQAIVVNGLIQYKSEISWTQEFVWTKLEQIKTENNEPNNNTEAAYNTISHKRK